MKEGYNREQLIQLMQDIIENEFDFDMQFIHAAEVSDINNIRNPKPTLAILVMNDPTTVVVQENNLYMSQTFFGNLSFMEWQKSSNTSDSKTTVTNRTDLIAQEFGIRLSDKDGLIVNNWAKNPQYRQTTNNYTGTFMSFSIEVFDNFNYCCVESN